MAKRNPHDPAARIKAENERREQAQEIERLKASGAEVTLDRGGKLISARRSNVFMLFLARKTIELGHYNAVYELAEDWAIWKGLDGKADRMGELVDGASGCREIVTDRMIAAGRRVNATLSELRPKSRIILEHFMVATVEEDRAMQWRGIMERIGIKTPHKQAPAIVEALEDLRQHREGRERRAA